MSQKTIFWNINFNITGRIIIICINSQGLKKQIGYKKYN